MIENSLITASANLFETYRRAHLYHINIEGSKFVEHHTFLKGIYESMIDRFDSCAERLRVEGYKLPGDFESKSTIISNDRGFDDCMKMLEDLRLSILICIHSIREAREDAESIKSYGTVAAMESLIEQLSKDEWMIRSILK